MNKIPAIRPTIRVAEQHLLVIELQIRLRVFLFNEMNNRSLRHPVKLLCSVKHHTTPMAWSKYIMSAMYANPIILSSFHTPVTLST
jgi:hypothetical protein